MAAIGNYCRNASQTVKVLLEAGAAVNAANDTGTTALMKAAERCTDNGVVEVLLHAGADVNAVDVMKEAAVIKVVAASGQYCYDSSRWSRNAVARKIVKVSLLWGLSEENRKKALALASSFREPDAGLVHMLSTPFHTLAADPTESGAEQQSVVSADAPED